MQWVVNAYTLCLASLLLIGGALGDQRGRRTIFALGLAVFAVASVACGLAANTLALDRWHAPYRARGPRC